MKDIGKRMKEYHVAYMCIYSDAVEADSPEEAAKIVEADCPLDIDGAACVTDVETGEQWEV